MNKSKETIVAVFVCAIVFGIAASYASSFWEQWRLSQEGLSSFGYERNPEQATPPKVQVYEPAVLNAPPRPILEVSFSI
ncbi:hypothetical protein SH449x_003609 [Pirellulaceae bacterium SH449]